MLRESRCRSRLNWALGGNSVSWHGVAMVTPDVRAIELLVKVRREDRRKVIAPALAERIMQLGRGEDALRCGPARAAEESRPRHDSRQTQAGCPRIRVPMPRGQTG